MVNLIFIGADGTEMPLKIGYDDLDDASGDLRAGAINDFVRQYGNLPVKSIRIDLDEAAKMVDDDFAVELLEEASN